MEIAPLSSIIAHRVSVVMFEKKRVSLSLSLVQQSQTIREIRSIERLNFFLSLIPKKKKRISFYQRFFKKEKYHPLDSTISYIYIYRSKFLFFFLDRFPPSKLPSMPSQKKPRAPNWFSIRKCAPVARNDRWWIDLPIFPRHPLAQPSRGLSRRCLGG